MFSYWHKYQIRDVKKKGRWQMQKDCEIKTFFAIKAVHILLISTLLLLYSEDKTPLQLKSVQLNYMGVRICCASCSTGILLCLLISGSSHLLMLLQELTEPIFSHPCSLGSVKFDVFRSYTPSTESRARFERLGQDWSRLRSVLKQETSAFLYRGKTLGNNKKKKICSSGTELPCNVTLFD